jgi:putative nucleotidyltransferase with HDIG domain
METKIKLRNKKNIIEEIREFVEEECKRPTNKYGYETFTYHFLPVVKYSKELAKQKNADLEIVEIAALLHDIGSIIYGRENHHITGAEIAEKKLKDLNYPQEKIEIIKKCILNHRGSMNNLRESDEEKIIAEADSLSTFDCIEGKFIASYAEGLSQSEARASVKNKFINKWNQLSSEEKKLIKPKFDAAMLLLN